MNFLELILHLLSKARNIALSFGSLDFSSLDHKVLGLASVLDIISVILAAFIIKEFVVYMLSFSLNILRSLSHSVYQYSSTFLMAFFSIFLMRVYYTLIYLYKRPAILDLQDKALSFFRDRVRFLPTLKK